MPNRTAFAKEARSLGISDKGTVDLLAKRIGAKRAQMERAAPQPSSPESVSVESIVYTQVTADDDSDEELKGRCQEALITEVENITPCEEGGKLVYGNLEGQGIFRRLSEMEDQRKRDEDRFRHMDARIMSLNARTMSLETEVEGLKRLNAQHHNIRSRFLSICKRDVLGHPTETDRNIIKDGNSEAHDGDPRADCALYQTRKRVDDPTYTALYGLPWNKVSELKHTETLNVLAAHATIKSSDKEHDPGKGRFYSLFQAFIDAFWASECRIDYLDDPTSEQAKVYYRFWAEYEVVKPRL